MCYRTNTLTLPTIRTLAHTLKGIQMYLENISDNKEFNIMDNAMNNFLMDKAIEMLFEYLKGYIFQHYTTEDQPDLTRQSIAEQFDLFDDVKEWEGIHKEEEK